MSGFLVSFRNPAKGNSMTTVSRPGDERVANLPHLPLGPDSKRMGRLSVGMVGLGYVGLPTALAFHQKGHRVIGVDLSLERLSSIAEQRVDLTDLDLKRLADANESDQFQTTNDVTKLSGMDVLMICVPTPVDPYLVPDHSFVRLACADVSPSRKKGRRSSSRQQLR